MEHTEAVFLPPLQHSKKSREDEEQRCSAFAIKTIKVGRKGDPKKTTDILLSCTWLPTFPDESTKAGGKDEVREEEKKRGERRKRRGEKGMKERTWQGGHGERRGQRGKEERRQGEERGERRIELRKKKEERKEGRGERGEKKRERRGKGGEGRGEGGGGAREGAAEPGTCFKCTTTKEEKKRV